MASLDSTEGDERYSTNHSRAVAALMGVEDGQGTKMPHTQHYAAGACGPQKVCAVNRTTSPVLRGDLAVPG